MPEEHRITTEARGHVLPIGLNRTAKLNAFDPQLVPQILSLMKTDDAREGLMSFVERRTAKFEGR